MRDSEIYIKAGHVDKAMIKIFQFNLPRILFCPNRK